VQVLAALSCVNHLVSFSDDTPCNLIRVIRPEVFVKGGDYKRERLPEAPLVEAFGGVSHILLLPRSPLNHEHHRADSE
jgi:D-beta-D-heptose 7-phosphate kinase/D-beta-D-heptose 1-phosphate adenosyltransferase